jgi:hypothetical protein
MNEKYWAGLLDLVEHGSRIVNDNKVNGKRRLQSFDHITEEQINRIKKDYRIF